MFDYEMGKISAEDHERLLAKTKLEAAEIRHQIDRLSHSVATDVKALDVEIERLVAQLRNSQLAESEALLVEVDAEIDLLKNTRLNPAEMMKLPVLTAANPFYREMSFCSGCGQPLPDLMRLTPPAKVDICSACGYAYQAEDAFCARCGLALLLS